MNPTLTAVVLLIAFVCFVAAAANVPTRINLIGAGLACWILVPLVAASKAL